MFSDEITLNDMLETHAASRGNRRFIFHRSGFYTYQETWYLAECFAAYLMRCGTVKGDSVGIALPRRPEYLFAFLGATRIGALPFGINYLLPLDQVLVLLRQVRPKVIVSAGPFLKAMLQVEHRIIYDVRFIDADAENRACDSWNEIQSCLPTPSDHRPSVEDIAYLNFTTGTTGAAKGALATHRNIFWNTRSAVECFDLTDQDVQLVMFASFAHPHELFSRALMTGGALVLLEEINPKTIAQTIAENGVTCMMGLAPMYAMMGDYCGRAQFDSLRIAESGGMYTSPATNSKFRRKAGVPILSVWGSTETTGIALANTPGQHREDGSMGQACPFYEVKVADESGESVRIESVGELWIRGSAVVSGYEGSETILDPSGWYRSGDLVWQGTDGYFRFVERMSGLIKVAGLKVYPLQIEIVLLEMPGIEEAAVIEAHDARRGAAPVAFLVCDGKSIKESDILLWCRNRLSSYMVPRRFFMLESLPKIGSGKIDKRLLQQSYAVDLQRFDLNRGETV